MITPLSRKLPQRGSIWIDMHVKMSHRIVRKRMEPENKVFGRQSTEINGKTFKVKSHIIRKVHECTVLAEELIISNMKLPSNNFHNRRSASVLPEFDEVGLHLLEQGAVGC